MHAFRQHGAPLHDELRRERLVRKAHVHHARRVPLGGGQIDQPPVRQDEDALAVQTPFVHELPYGRRSRRRLFQTFEVDLHVEVPRVREHRAVLHRPHVLHADHVDVPRERDEDVAHGCRLGHRHHAVAVHLRLEGLEGIDLRHQHDRPGPARPHRDAAAAPPIPRHHHRAAREQQVGGAHNAVERGLTGAVAVIEQVLRVRVVHGDHRELEHAVFRHRPEPDDAGGSLLRGAEHARHEPLAISGGERLHPAPHGGREVVQPVQGDHVERADQVGAVVHGEVGPVGERRADVLVIGLVVLALDGEHLGPVVAHQVGRHVVLRRQRIGGAQRHVRPARLQGDDQVRRLRGDVQAGREAFARERALAREALPQLAQHRHGALGPFGPPPPLVGLAQVFDVVRGAVRRGGHRVALLVS